MQWNAFFARLDRERDLCGLTDQSLSLAAGLSKDGIRNWRRTVAKNPDGGPNLTSVIKVAATLNVNVAYLLGETDLRSPNNMIKSDALAWRRSEPIDAPFSWENIGFESVRENHARILIGSDCKFLQVMSRVEKSGLPILIAKIDEFSLKLK